MIDSVGFSHALLKFCLTLAMQLDRIYQRDIASGLAVDYGGICFYCGGRSKYTEYIAPPCLKFEALGQYYMEYS